jgi:hypothetical protein
VLVTEAPAPTHAARIDGTVVTPKGLRKGIRIATVPASPFQPDIWREWELVDLPYAILPCVQLADQAGIAVPLHRAFAEILGVLLGVDPWKCGRRSRTWTSRARRGR